jgi:hypothetical protein
MHAEPAFGRHRIDKTRKWRTHRQRKIVALGEVQRRYLVGRHSGNGPRNGLGGEPGRIDDAPCAKPRRAWAAGLNDEPVHIDFAADDRCSPMRSSPRGARRRREAPA